MTDLEAAIRDHLDRQVFYSKAEMRAATNHAEMRRHERPDRPEWWGYMGATNQVLADVAMAQGIWALPEQETTSTEEGQA